MGGPILKNLGAGYGSAYGNTFGWVNAAYGVNVAGWSNIAGIGEFIGDRLLFAPSQSTPSISWPSSGSVGATANGPGILDTTGGGMGGLGDVQGPVGEPEVPDEVVDWGSIFSRVIETPTKLPGGTEVAIDWGGVLSGAVSLGSQYIETKYAQPTFQSFVAAPQPPAPAGSIGGPEGIVWGNGGAGAPPMVTNAACPPAGSCGPRYLTYDCKTGQMTVRRRRRRGKLLTAGRKEDLAFVIAMYGKGAASQIALAKAMS